MLRKAIGLAKKTLVLSLPSSWIKLNNIVKGDLLEIDVFNSHLLVKKSGIPKKRVCTLDLDKAGISGKGALLRLYESGFDEVSVLFSKKAQFDAIMPALGELLGFEIVQQRKNFAVINDISSQNVEDYDQILSRAFWLIRQVIDDIVHALQQHDIHMLKSMAQRDIQINKMCRVLLRLLAKGKFSQPIDHSRHVLLVWQLENFADTLKKFAVLATVSKPDMHVIESVDNLLGLFEMYRKLITAPSAELLNQSRVYRQELVKRMQSLSDTALAQVLSQSMDALLQIELIQIIPAVGVNANA